LVHGRCNPETFLKKSLSRKDFIACFLINQLFFIAATKRFKTKDSVPARLAGTFYYAHHFINSMNGPDTTVSGADVGGGFAPARSHIPHVRGDTLKDLVRGFREFYQNGAAGQVMVELPYHLRQYRVRGLAGQYDFE
jgi:hypothetical protein